MKKIAVLVADDGGSLRQALVRVLSARSDRYQVVATAGDGEEVIRRAETLKPDLAVLDIQMAGIDGIEASFRIISGNPGAAIVILSSRDGYRYILAMPGGQARANANLFRRVNDDVDGLVDAIEAVASGRVIPDGSMRGNLALGNSAPSHSPSEPLTDEEHQLLIHLAGGYSTVEAMREMKVDPLIFKDIAAGLMSKLGMRPEAMTWSNLQQVLLGMTKGWTATPC